jgi:predicted adenylyl cyclase CyaB
MTQETEIKLRVNHHDEAKRLLLRHGFHIRRDRVFERNFVFDTADQALRGSKRLLRLREAGDHVTLTYKGVAETGKHKTREEREVRVENFDEMQVILERLGYTVAYRYEKHRTEFALAESSGIATIDETPAGTFMELEGRPEWIDSIAARLGFQESDYITASYATLYSRPTERRD